MSMLRYVAVVLVVLIVASGAARLYGQLTSDTGELEALGFGTCSGQPCFMGLLPGVSSWKETLSTLRTYDLKVVDVNTQVSVAYANWKEIQIGVTSNNGRVTSIQITPVGGERTVMPLHAIIQQMGIPCGVGFIDGHLLYPRLVYPSVWVDVFAFDKRIEQDGFVDSVLITPEARSSRCTSTADFPLVGWKGFAALTRYDDH